MVLLHCQIKFGTNFMYAMQKNTGKNISSGILSPITGGGNSLIINQLRIHKA